MTGRRVAASTQERNPRSASVRTAFAAAVALFPLLNGILAVIIEVLRPYDATIPGWVFIWLNGALVAVTVVIMLVTRVMAIPGVNDWLRKYARWLSPEDKPKPAPPADPELTDWHDATPGNLVVQGGDLSVHGGEFNIYASRDPDAVAKAVAREEIQP
ncbi:hypothetical protein AOC05_04880 [Arthrobacter alpinus]|uniref:Uncharacterized protein n=1 Tax=Arthrobacter alpinus TaxID=656366 RepID=A0A0M4RMT5_9MICC|nr:hypothetical protein [Arthrobacter alpinus]ALE91808.1 hypothetical protein AOC05_04880 [Arthrobacter alpinus]